MDDGLKVQKFTKQESSIKDLQINTKTVRRLSKMKVGFVLIALASAGVVVYNAIDEANYDVINHAHDIIEDGNIIHPDGELNTHTFIADYKAVNEKATEEDVMKAIEDGDLEYYKDHNGRIENIAELQQEVKDPVQFYNDDCVGLADKVVAEHFTSHK